MTFNIDTDIDTVSEEWLEGFIRRMEKENGILAGLDEGNRIIKLSPTMVVKCGYGVTAQEAAAQTFAHQHFDSSIVQIPRVHRFFHSSPCAFGSCGYLFMDYIEGWSLENLDLQVHTDLIPQIATIIAHMESMASEIPGPPGGGRPEGYLWSDEGARTEFHSVEELNTWLNARLATQDKSINITSEKLVFCHMDLCRRNMIMLPNRTICLLDFGFAGFYPRCFEVVTLDFLTTESVEYTRQLQRRLMEELRFTGNEKEYLALLHRVRAIQARFPSAFGEKVENLLDLPELVARLPSTSMLPSQIVPPPKIEPLSPEDVAAALAALPAPEPKTYHEMHPTLGQPPSPPPPLS